MEALTFSLSTIEQTEDTNTTSQIEVSSPAVLQRLLTPYDLNIDMDSAKLYLEERAVFLAFDRETGEDISSYQYKLVVRDSSGQTFSPRESSPLGQLNRLFDPEDEQYLRNPKERTKLAALLQSEKVPLKSEEDITRLVNLIKHFGDLETDDLIKIYKLDKKTSDYPLITISGLHPKILANLRDFIIASIQRRFPNREDTLINNSIIWDSLPNKKGAAIEVEEFEDCIQIRDANTKRLILQIGNDFLPKAWLLYLASQDCQDRENCSIRIYPDDTNKKVVKI